MFMSFGFADDVAASWFC